MQLYEWIHRIGLRQTGMQFELQRRRHLLLHERLGFENIELQVRYDYSTPWDAMKMKGIPVEQLPLQYNMSFLLPVIPTIYMHTYINIFFHICTYVHTCRNLFTFVYIHAYLHNITCCTTPKSSVSYKSLNIWTKVVVLSFFVQAVCAMVPQAGMTAV